MSISSRLHSPFYSHNVVENKFDIECLPTQDPFLSSYNTDHSGNISNLFDSYDSETPAVPSNPLMPRVCNSSSATNSQSWNRLPRTVTAVKKNHKMIERQRRKEMKMLFSRLRSTLPEKDTQGKRTVSEQVLESVNYIGHLQQKIRELSAQREEMKVNSDPNAKVSFEKFCNKIPSFEGSDREYHELKINSVGSGVQIWTNYLERDIVYSDILMVLEEGGLEVVSAASSVINNRVYHTIHAKVYTNFTWRSHSSKTKKHMDNGFSVSNKHITLQVFDLTTFNTHSLYQKLWHLIRTHHSSNEDLGTTEAQG